MKEDIFFKVEVVDLNKRTRVIADNLKGRPSHKGPFRIKGKFKNCPVINLDINIPVYHLNNGRTRELQKSYTINNNKKENFFEQGLENNNQQRIQHSILFKLSQDNTANIYRELKISNSFREDSPLLIDMNGMLINGNRRMAAIRELYKSDEKKYKDFRTVPCAVIQEHLSDIDIKEIENFLQVKREHKAEYSWISLCLEVQNEKKRLNRTTKQIATDMGKSEVEIEKLFNLTNIIDKCLEEDHKSKGNYELIKDQKQLWNNTEERASKKGTTKGERDLIYKIARMISVNSGKFGDRDYRIASSLQKKNNLSQVMQHFKEKYRSIKSSTPIRDKNDPFRGLDRVDPKAQIYPLEVDQIPVKDGDKQIQILLDAEESLLQSGDDNAAVKYSKDALKKIISMHSMRYPDQYKKEVKNNINELIRKCQRLIKDKKL
jgi:hypothetical protein